MNMANACWMRRSLDEPVSALSIGPYQHIIVGGWNGRLTMWSNDGDELWSVHLPDRIGCIVTDGASIFATAGLHLCAINSEDGIITWQHALEGSADQVTVIDKLIFATSSVYDIEHNDFIDSAVWCFDEFGNKLWEKHIAERPWALVNDSRKLFLGLGRPRTGVVEVATTGEMKHSPLPSTSPVTTGVETAGGPLFGHANGDLTTLQDRVFDGDGSSISSVSCGSDNSITLCCNNKLSHLAADFSPVWEVELSSITALSRGLIIGGHETIWLGHARGTEYELRVISQQSGEQISAMSCGKLTSIISDDNRVIAGDENGEIYVWERGMFNRRLADLSSELEQDEKRVLMRDKLNKLRKR